MGSTNGANAFAGTALDALVGVDLVFAVTLIDSADRAFLGAGTAFDASITDFICHKKQTSFALGIFIVTSTTLKIKRISKEKN